MAGTAGRSARSARDAAGQRVPGWTSGAVRGVHDRPYDRERLAGLGEPVRLGVDGERAAGGQFRPGDAGDHLSAGTRSVRRGRSARAGAARRRAAARTGSGPHRRPAREPRSRPRRRPAGRSDRGHRPRRRPARRSLAQRARPRASTGRGPSRCARRRHRRPGSRAARRASARRQRARSPAQPARAPGRVRRFGAIGRSRGDLQVSAERRDREDEPVQVVVDVEVAGETRCR